MSFDSWKTTNPADNELGRSNGRPFRFRCLDCAWTGASPMARRHHWVVTEHRIVYRDDPRPSPMAPPIARSGR